MEFNGSNLISRLEKLQKNLSLKIEKSIKPVMEEIASEIGNRNSRAWKRPMKRDGSGPYFSTDNPSPGLFNALEKVKNQISILGNKNTINIGLGNAIQLSIDFPYWDLFEGYGIYERSAATRAGGSMQYGFIPRSGWGKRGQGFMSSNVGETHPGVLPSFMFRNTMRYFKPKLFGSIKNAIKDL